MYIVQFILNLLQLTPNSHVLISSIGKFINIITTLLYTNIELSHQLIFLTVFNLFLTEHVEHWEYWGRFKPHN